MKKYLLFVDLETSSKPESLNHPVTAEEEWPYILQIAWQVYDDSGNHVKTEDHYIYDHRIRIDKSSQQLHGITLDTLANIGESRKDVLRRFAGDLRRFRPTIVGHFVEFDSKMLQVGLFRAGMKNIVKNFAHFCTMSATSDYAVSIHQTYPKLDELYFRLFREHHTEAHNALADVKATVKVFFELVSRKEIDPDNLDQSKFNKMKTTVKQKTGCGLPILVVLIIAIWIIL